MGELDALAIGGKHHGVVSHDIATSEGVHADATLRTRTGFAYTAVVDVVVVGGIGFFVENF